MARIGSSLLSAFLACALTTGISLHAASASTETASKAKVKSTRPAAERKATERKVVVERKAKPAAGKATVAARRSGAVRVAYKPAEAEEPVGDNLILRSSVAFVQDLDSSDVLFAKNDATVAPIASITKLMTALVVIEAGQPLDEQVEITEDDIDNRKFTRSRLSVGTRLSRKDMLHLALMASENRAANALGRNYPGGLSAMVEAMNHKAAMLGMTNTHYIEPTGLSSENVSSPHDLVRLLRVASQEPLIHEFTTDTSYQVAIQGRDQTFHNTNRLVARSDWDIQVSKTGFINEAGQCLVMLAKVGGRDLAIVLLDSVGRIKDAQRVHQWLQRQVGAL